ncbi:MAG: homocysteine S-methyltransferase family protein [Chitinivibrionales bacterium]|nr:homocysteine S-methyltransferase family protein [Chitinivibrionales bacterium]
MISICQEIARGRILVSDGAWGTFLQQKGLQSQECPETWCLTHRADGLDIAKSYIEAGADMVETNSFGANRIKLAQYGLESSAVELNMAAAAISREAAGSDHYVIASMGPTGKILMMGEVSEAAVYDAYAEQAAALCKGGADGLCIETMSALDESEIAVRAARQNSTCAVICTFTFQKTIDGQYRTMMGVSPAEMAAALGAAGADIIGTNCGNGIEGMIPIVNELRAAAPERPILVHANAGLPVLKGTTVTYPESPEMMAGNIALLVAAGAAIIGGCCGTTPAHIRAMAQAVKKMRR